SFVGCLALHAFDVPVHGPETGVVDRLALRHALGAGVVDDGPGEGMDGAIDDALLHALGIGDHVFRDLLVVVPDHHFAGGDARPAVIGLPGPGHHVLDDADVVRGPDVDDGTEMRIRREGT